MEKDLKKIKTALNLEEEDKKNIIDEVDEIKGEHVEKIKTRYY